MKVNVPILKFLFIFNGLILTSLSFLIVSVEYDCTIFSVIEDGIVEVVSKMATNLVFTTGDQFQTQ